MNSPRKIQSVIVLIFACIFVPALAAEPNEPNEPKAELTFETSIETMEWFVRYGKTEEGKPLYFTNPGPIKPSYVARVLLHEGYPRSGSATGVMDKILDSPIAKKFSKEQQKFFKTELVARIDAPERIPFYYSTWLYATSKEDAKLMVQAYIDGLNRFVGKRVAEQERRVAEYQQAQKKAQKELLEKQSELKTIEQRYKNVKEATHQFSSDDEAAELAKKSIIEMDKTLNALDIELAGIRERLKAVARYQDKPGQRDVVYQRLDEMFIEQMIELSGLEARKKVTEEIRDREQDFLHLYNEHRELRNEVHRLSGLIEDSQVRIDDIVNDLNNLPPYMQPPKVYRNTVTIYPVLTDD